VWDLLLYLPVNHHHGDFDGCDDIPPNECVTAVFTQFVPRVVLGKVIHPTIKQTPLYGAILVDIVHLLMKIKQYLIGISINARTISLRVRQEK